MGSGPLLFVGITETSLDLVYSLCLTLLLTNLQLYKHRLRLGSTTRWRSPLKRPRAKVIDAFIVKFGLLDSSKGVELQRLTDVPLLPSISPFPLSSSSVLSPTPPGTSGIVISPFTIFLFPRLPPSKNLLGGILKLVRVKDTHCRDLLFEESN